MKSSQSAGDSISQGLECVQGRKVCVCVSKASNHEYLSCYKSQNPKRPPLSSSQHFAESVVFFFSGLEHKCVSVTEDKDTLSPSHMVLLGELLNNEGSYTTSHTSVIHWNKNREQERTNLPVKQNAFDPDVWLIVILYNHNSIKVGNLFKTKIKPEYSDLQIRET